MALLVAAIADPSRKDVVIAILGASAALGGFILLFLGLLISAYQGLSADAVASVREQSRRFVWPVLGVFALSMAAIALALVWLAVPGGTCLYRAVVGLFAAELVAIVAVAAGTTVRLVR